MTDSKHCPSCNNNRPRGEFVTIYGYPSTRGKYCQSCFHTREQEHVRQLMDGRDFCLYCGKKVERYCDYSPEGRSIKTYLNWDHMDPVSGGGHNEYGALDVETGEFSEDDRNLVYCCAECNFKKGRMPFIEWLNTLKPKYQKLAREVYAEKHDGKSPEEFRPDDDDGIIIRIGIDL